MREAKHHPRRRSRRSGEFLATYREVAQAADAIISVHASSKLSGTFRSAETAATTMLRQERPDVRIETIDALTIATCQGVVAMRGAPGRVGVVLRGGGGRRSR